MKSQFTKWYESHLLNIENSITKIPTLLWDLQCTHLWVNVLVVSLTCKPQQRGRKKNTHTHKHIVIVWLQAILNFFKLFNSNLAHSVFQNSYATVERVRHYEIPKIYMCKVNAFNDCTRFKLPTVNLAFAINSFLKVRHKLVVLFYCVFSFCF